MKLNLNLNNVRPDYRRDIRREVASIDYILLLIITAIVCFSLISIGNCTLDAAPQDASFWQKLLMLRDSRYVMLQALWFVTGVIIMFAVAIIFEREFYDNLIWVYYALIVGALAILWIIGESTRGAVSWFTLGERGLQPSEFCKIAIILCLAKLLSAQDEKITRFNQIVPAVAMFAIPFILIMLQPDLGTALVCIAIFVGMIFVAGVNFKIIFTGVGAAAIAIPLAIKYVLNDEQRLRLNGFFGMSGASTSDDVYQLTQSKLAIGSGGMRGNGFLTAGSISQLDYVPDQHTDFIFSATAEAFGFVGASVLIGLYLLLLLRLLYMAHKTPDRFGKLVIVGVCSMFFFHIFENIGMTIGIMPITGIPLPFMSYGGSNMWTNMICIGLAQNVYCRRNRVRYSNQNKLLL